MADYCQVYGVISHHVTCGLTACTPGSAPGPTLGNEYGKTLLYFTFLLRQIAVNEQPSLIIHASFKHIKMYLFINLYNRKLMMLICLLKNNKR